MLVCLLRPMENTATTVPRGRPHKRIDDHVLAVSANAALILIFLIAMLLKLFEDIEDQVRERLQEPAYNPAHHAPGRVQHFLPFVTPITDRVG